MKILSKYSRPVLASWVASAAICAAVAYAWTIEEKAPVMVEGYHYLPPKFLVTEFRVNYAVGGSVWFGGEGGDVNCCIVVPTRWRKGLVADVRWVVWDWSAASEEEFEKSDFAHAKKEGVYRAMVPVEPYETLGNLYVHFFPGGKVRVTASNYYPESPNSPIRRGDPKAILSSTQGVKVDELYTKDELEEHNRREKRFREKYGDWR